MTEETTYRERFKSKGSAAQYEDETYRPGSYNEAIWHIEQLQLLQLLGEFRRTHSIVDYLDFACGTGRVLAFMEPHVDSARGIEISPSMAEIARRKVIGAKIDCMDITSSSTLHGKYDLISAFRFITNAEPALRLAALRALAQLLRDRGSCIVFNNHGSLFSRKLLAWPVLAIRNFGKRDLPFGRSMTHREVLRLANAAGLKATRVFGTDVLGAQLSKLIYGQRNAFERELALSSGRLGLLGVNQLYVARLR